jgi:hypothetical protein
MASASRAALISRPRVQAVVDESAHSLGVQQRAVRPPQLGLNDRAERVEGRVPPGQPHLANADSRRLEGGVDGILDRGVDAVDAQPADQAARACGDREARFEQAHPGDDARRRRGPAGRRCPGWATAARPR